MSTALVNRRAFLGSASALLAASRLNAARRSSSHLHVFFGTRDNVKAKGIYSCRFDSIAGTCGPVSLTAELELPSALVASADGRHLYAVSAKDNEGNGNGSLFAFAVDPDSGRLQPQNRVSSGGADPTFISLDATGRTLAVANYGSGRTTAFRVLPDGKLGEQTASMAHSGTGPHRRQTAPHAHNVAFSPDNRFLLAADLGADRVFVFRFDASTGTLSAHNPSFAQLPAGFGPRGLVFHRNGKIAYLMSELVGRVTVFAWDAGRGVLSEIRTVPAVSADDTGTPSGAGITISPAGTFLFTTTRNDHAVESFPLERRQGTLGVPRRVPAEGKLPWSCALDPGGRHLFVTNMASDAVSVFRIHPGSGELAPLRIPLSVPAPVCAAFVPAAR